MLKEGTTLNRSKTEVPFAGGVEARGQLACRVDADGACSRRKGGEDGRCAHRNERVPIVFATKVVVGEAAEPLRVLVFREDV